MQREVLISEVCRTGVQTVERELDVCAPRVYRYRYFVTIKNRSYESEHEIPIGAARRLYKAMKQ